MKLFAILVLVVVHIFTVQYVAEYNLNLTVCSPIL